MLAKYRLKMARPDLNYYPLILLGIITVLILEFRPYYCAHFRP
jgi:hypothetical protein